MCGAAGQRTKASIFLGEHAGITAANSAGVSRYQTQRTLASSAIVSSRGHSINLDSVTEVFRKREGCVILAAAMDFEFDSAILGNACGPSPHGGASKSRGCFALRGEPAKKNFFPAGGHDNSLKRLKTAKPIHGNPSFFLGIIWFALGLAWPGLAEFGFGSGVRRCPLSARRRRSWPG